MLLFWASVLTILSRFTTLNKFANLLPEAAENWILGLSDVGP